MLEPAAGITIADRYRLDEKLGEGGMGSVWLAHDEKLRRQVAVKLVTERISESKRALARFEREAMSVARLRSPYITQVYDYGVEDGSPYIIMELLEGADLKALLATQGRLSLQDTARVVVQVSKALHAAHSKGIVHRDLKPANVFVAEEHGEQICKVFDFGVAKALNDLADDGETTAEGVLLGTPRYMSPEQAHGAKEVDHRTDLWSLGVIAYICVTGRLPFIAAGTGHILVKVCTEDPPKPSELVEYLPATVDQYFAKALAKEPDDRFQNAKEMGLAFAELAEVSLSSFSLSSSPGMSSPGRASWTGISGSYPGTSIASGASDVDDGSQAASVRRRDVSVGDGTLGAATKSPVSRGPRLGSRGMLIAAGIAAALAIAALVGVATFKRGGESQAPASNASSSADVPVAASGAGPTVSAEPTSSEAAPPSEPSATAATDEGEEPEPPAPSPPPHARKPRPGSNKVADTPEPAQPDPPPQPKANPKNPKSKDGLDLFNGRF